MRIGAVIVAIFAIVFAACNGDDDGSDGADVALPTQVGEFEEGTIRVEIEMLDTGLLKGHSYVDTAEGWNIDGVDVTAVTDSGKEWGVIEIDEPGEAAESVTFFEVQIQELPRGEQVTVATTVNFTDAGGFRAERTVSDKWPP
jgi:VCBS repeat-containing protein